MIRQEYIGIQRCRHAAFIEPGNDQRRGVVQRQFKPAQQFRRAVVGRRRKIFALNLPEDQADGIDAGNRGPQFRRHSKLFGQRLADLVANGQDGAVGLDVAAERCPPENPRQEFQNRLGPVAQGARRPLQRAAQTLDRLVDPFDRVPRLVLPLPLGAEHVRDMLALIKVQFLQPIARKILVRSHSWIQGCAHQGGQGGKTRRFQVIGRRGQQAKGGGIGDARPDTVTDWNAALPQTLFHVGHDPFVGHADGDLLGVIAAREAGDRAEHRFRLLGRTVGHFHLPVRQGDFLVEPCRGADAPVRVETIGELCRREDQRRHAVRHLVEDHPLRAIQVGGADQHDWPSVRHSRRSIATNRAVCRSHKPSPSSWPR